jgi:hypothetical protein
MAPKVSRIRVRKSDLKAGIDKLKQGPAVKAELQKQAKAIARRANRTLKQKQPYVDYDTGFHPGKNPTATVFTRSNHAKYSNAKHNTLIKVIK